MEILRPGLDLDRFWQEVAASPRPLLMLDYDGTLAPFQEERMEARPYPWVPPLLKEIMAGRSRVVVISGRVVEEVEALLGLGGGLEIWGAHGLERREAGGRFHPHREEPVLSRALARAVEWGRCLGLDGRLERKPGAVALHLRGMEAEEAARLQEEALALFRSLARLHPRLRTSPFDGGVELREGGLDKGTAVATILRESPGNAAAFLGDDLTDEDGFRVLEGRGLGVLVRREPRETGAALRLEPPHELRWFLERWREAAGEVA